MHIGQCRVNVRDHARVGLDASTGRRSPRWCTPCPAYRESRCSDCPSERQPVPPRWSLLESGQESFLEETSACGVETVGVETCVEANVSRTTRSRGRLPRHYMIRQQCPPVFTTDQIKSDHRGVKGKHRGYDRISVVSLPLNLIECLPRLTFDPHKRAVLTPVWSFFEKWVKRERALRRAL
jgi:hypothetical protein